MENEGAIIPFEINFSNPSTIGFFLIGGRGLQISKITLMITDKLIFDSVNKYEFKVEELEAYPPPEPTKILIASTDTNNPLFSYLNEKQKKSEIEITKTELFDNTGINVREASFGLKFTINSFGIPSGLTKVNFKIYQYLLDL